ncbi:MAG: UDP-N-acetyl glucosamine 2-epimerase, partial [ANME-2 cluster archaeon]|nr:UDP-N-acetyl glucosamine 2-epimerase [ANME-2 cluster archaeon]
KDLHLTAGEYFLATVHRQENVDEKKTFEGIIKALERVGEELGLPVLYPIHPRAKKRMEEFDIEINTIELIDPLDYPGFLQLESNARVVLTDSGGVQEETCILNVPCVSLRDNTERPETIEAGSNIIAGTSPGKILDSVRHMVKARQNWANPFGDGRAGEKIIRILERHI